MDWTDLIDLLLGTRLGRAIGRVVFVVLAIAAPSILVAGLLWYAQHEASTLTSIFRQIIATLPTPTPRQT